MYDLVLNDDSILNDGFNVRDELGANKEFFNFLVDRINISDVSASNEAQIREYILMIIFKVYQRLITDTAKTHFDPDVEKNLLQVMADHKQKL